MPILNHLPTMVGVVSQSSAMHGVRTCPRFGLFEPVFQTNDGMLLTARGDKGYVTGYTRVDSADAKRGLVPFDVGTLGPRLNEPVPVALIYQQPDGIPVGMCAPWDEVATHACGEAFPELCEQMRQHPLEGFNLARFLTVDVKRYAQHAVGGGGFDFEAHASRIREFALIRDELRAAHPGWSDIETPTVHLPRRGGIDPSLN